MRGGARAKRSGCSHALKEAACGTERGAASAPCMRAPLAARCCALRCALAALHSHPKTTTPLHATQNKGRTPARRPGRLPRRATPPRRGGAAAPSPRAPPARRSTTCSASPPPRRSATSKRRTARRRSSCTPTSTRRCAAARKGGEEGADWAYSHTHTQPRSHLACWCFSGTHSSAPPKPRHIPMHTTINLATTARRRAALHGGQGGVRGAVGPAAARRLRPAPARGGECGERSDLKGAGAGRACMYQCTAWHQQLPHQDSSTPDRPLSLSLSPL